VVNWERIRSGRETVEIEDEDIAGGQDRRREQVGRDRQARANAVFLCSYLTIPTHVDREGSMMNQSFLERSSDPGQSSVSSTVLTTSLLPVLASSTPGGPTQLLQVAAR
jgi:hypothetical protein